MLTTAWILARKDLVLFFRDRTALALTLLLPILLATIFGSAMKGMSGGGGGGIRKVKLLVEDRDGSQASAQLVERLLESESFSARAAEGARAEVANGDAPAALVIQEGYGAATERGDIPELLLLRDPSQLIAQQAVTFGILPVLMESNFDRVGAKVMSNVLERIEFPLDGREEADAILRRSWESMDVLIARLQREGAFEAWGSSREDAEEPAGEPAGESSGADEAEGDGGFGLLSEIPAFLGVEIEDVAGARDGEIPRSAGGSHAIASMAVMMLMFSLVAAGGTILEERDGGTLQRLLLAPSSGSSILVGKLLTLGLVGLLQLAVLYVYGSIVFDVPIHRHLLEVCLISLVLVFSATGMGVLFGVACGSRKQLEGVSTLVILVMSAIGGAWFPREITPEWFQTAGLFTITAYAMDAFHGALWYGKGLFASGEMDGIWPQIAVLFGIGTALTALSFRVFRRRFVLRA